MNAAQSHQTFPGPGHTPGATPQVDVAAFMRSVYNWMAVGLILTGVIAAYVASNDELMLTIFGNRMLMWGLLIGELVMVWVFGRSVTRVGFGTAATMYTVYCAMSGLTFSVFFYVYTSQSLAIALYVTGGTFAAMSAYGMLTKRDLSSMGSMLMMALFGIIIASIVNLVIFQSSMMMMVISAISVLVFVGLTAYDTQKIRALAATGDRRLALAGALTLYLDFVNLFIALLRLFGRRR